jgi:hypothetical protein
MIGVVVVADTGVITAQIDVELVVRRVGQQGAFRLDSEHPR